MGGGWVRGLGRVWVVVGLWVDQWVDRWWVDVQNGGVDSDRWWVWWPLLALV